VIRALLVIAAVVLGAAGVAAAASFTLDDADKRAAIHAGERSTLAEGFDREWRVNGEGGQNLLVLTPFHRLLLASRNATFKNESIKPVEVERVLKQDVQRLIVWATLRGHSADFARHYVPRLQDGDREIRATFVQNERSARRQEDGRYLAHCVYGFATATLNPKGRVVLVVRDQDGREVTRFSVDLAAVR